MNFTSSSAITFAILMLSFYTMDYFPLPHMPYLQELRLTILKLHCSATIWSQSGNLLFLPALYKCSWDSYNHRIFSAYCLSFQTLAVKIYISKANYYIILLRRYKFAISFYSKNARNIAIILLPFYNCAIRIHDTVIQCPTVFFGRTFWKPSVFIITRVALEKPASQLLPQDSFFWSIKR